MWKLIWISSHSCAPKQKMNPQDCIKFQCAMFFKLFCLNVLCSMYNERCRGPKAARQFIFLLFHSGFLKNEENGNFNAVAISTDSKEFNLMIEANYFLTNIQHKPQKFEASNKLVSLLWNSQASPEATNSIPLLKVELYYIVLHKSETWEMIKNERTKAKSEKFEFKHFCFNFIFLGNSS